QAEHADFISSMLMMHCHRSENSSSRLSSSAQSAICVREKREQTKDRRASTSFARAAHTPAHDLGLKSLHNRIVARIAAHRCMQNLTRGSFSRRAATAEPRNFRKRQNE